MSSRALRRLERQKLQELGSKSGSETPEPKEEEIEGAEEEVKTSKFNAFALLNEDESDDDASEEDEKPVITETIQPKSKSKKKKKKKSKENKKQEELDSDEELDRILEEARKKDQQTGTKSPDNTLEDEYDFEEEFDQVNTPSAVYDSNFKFFTSKRLKQSLGLLSIKSISNLDQDQEYKNLFGNLSMDTIEDANSTTSLAISPELLQQFKKMARLTRGWGGNDRRSVPGTTRKLLLSRIRDDWLPTTLKPMNMEEIKPEEYLAYLEYKEDSIDLEDLQVKINKEKQLGVKYFKFSKVNNIKERVANTRFYASVVMTPDPESLMQLLQQYPYHVETLLQVSMVLLRQGDNKSASNALVERALFTFDRSFHKYFHEILSSTNSNTGGLIRLPYESYMNRQFYLCLFRYIIALGERSTFFTAFSYCKLLLSFSPAEDPLGVRYFMDFYCIMSEEFKYLIQFAQSPLCTTYVKWFTPGIAFSTVLAHLKLNDKENAKIALQKAYDVHPYTAFRLYQDVCLGHDPEIESRIKNNLSQETVLSTETYLVRAGVLWKDHEDVKFLHGELQEIFQTTKKDSSTAGGIKSSIYGLFGLSTTNNKQELQEDIPFNLIRFAVLSGENKIMAKLPKEFWSRDDTFEYDILPPKAEYVHYNEFSGIMQDKPKVTDCLLDYVDQNLLGTIIQTRTAADDNEDIEGIIRQLQEQDLQQE
ncbi:Ribosome quality control complex subunit 1 [Spathaspora sp. JA1]|nr:Ribosome quality control complex subunit 1 [Spathaspora sp. JA1]